MNGIINEDRMPQGKLTKTQLHTTPDRRFFGQGEEKTDRQFSPVVAFSEVEFSRESDYLHWGLNE
ncbi:MAG TPA: hypothetical protein VGE41_03755 [Verrucomicrobiae bacterium]|jgi:hypothetical protein